MRQFPKKYLTVLSFAMISTPVIAQTSFPTDTLQELQPLEVRSLRISGDAPFVKTELRRADIQSQNTGQDLPYLLQYTPSAVVSSDAGAGVGYTGLRIRGTDGTRINITLNGVAVNDAESQSTFFVNLPD